MPRLTLAAALAEDPAQPAAITVPLSDLYLHPLNPRHEPPEAEIEALAASIKAVGLLQNLSGFADGQIRFRPGHEHADPDHIGIVAGGRRLRALQMLASRGEWDAPVPVRITIDADMASQWAGAENETQRGLPIADRITAYGQMREKGHTIEAIAAAFATPISDVRRLLALATLPDAALMALRSGRISFDVAKALTAARTDQDQQAALNSALAGKAEWEIRNMLRKDSIGSTDRFARFVGLDAYHDAGGTSTLDLFAKTDSATESILHDAGLLKRLAQEKGEAMAEDIRAAEGWAWALFVPENTWQTTEAMRRIWGAPQDLPEGDAARLDELHQIDEDDLTEDDHDELERLEARARERHFTDADRAAAGIVTSINHCGEFTVERAYLRKGERAPGEDLAEGDIEIARATEASMPQNLKDDLRKIRLICIQDALSRDETLAQDLLALQLARKLKPWEQPYALDQTHAPPPGKAEGMTVPARLAAPDAHDKAEETSITLKAWLGQPEAAIDRALYNGLARAFMRTDGPIVDAIHARRPINARTLWTPNATNFFSRVSAGYLDALWRELVPDEGSRHDGFASLPKKEKAKELDRLFSDWSFREALGLSREVNSRIDAWLPEDLRFGAPEAEAEGNAE